MTKTVAITGCAGFIGSNLLARTLKKDWRVLGVDDMSNGHVEFIPKDFDNVFVGDFADEAFLIRVRQREFNTIFHLAACPRVSYSVEYPIETNDTNVTKTLKLIDACKESNTMFIFASSSAVYGEAKMPTTEGMLKNPKSPYALQKSIVEEYLRLYAELYSFNSVALRFFNVFGPNQLGDSPYATAVSSWLTAIMKGLPIRSDGDGTQTRDMCYVENVVDALVLAATLPSGRPRFQIFNVASGVSVSNNDIITELMECFPDQLLIKPAPARSGDVKHTLADLEKANLLLGYYPKIMFWEGLGMTIRWAKNSPDFLKLTLQKL